MGVRLANEFHGHSAESVAGNKTPEERSGWREGLRDHPEHDKEEQPFKACFIELGGMAAGWPSAALGAPKAAATWLL